MDCCTTSVTVCDLPASYCAAAPQVQATADPPGAGLAALRHGEEPGRIGPPWDARDRESVAIRPARAGRPGSGRVPWIPAASHFTCRVGRGAISTLPINGGY